jgi:hypothetical protein
MTQARPDRNPCELNVAEPEIDIEVTENGKIVMTPRRQESFEQAENPHTRRQLCGATIASGLAGFFCGGPVVAAVAAGGAALAVSSRSKTGEFARDSGEAVSKIGDRLRETDKQYHIIDKTRDNVIQGFEWVKKRIKPKDAQPHARTPPAT